MQRAARLQAVILSGHFHHVHHSTSQLHLILTSAAAGKPQPSAHEQQHQGLSAEEHAIQYAQPGQLDMPPSKSGSPGSTEQTAEIKLHSEEYSEHRCC